MPAGKQGAVWAADEYIKTIDIKNSLVTLAPLFPTDSIIHDVPLSQLRGAFSSGTVVKEFFTKAAFERECKAYQRLSNRKIIHKFTAMHAIKWQGKQYVGMSIANKYIILNKRCHYTLDEEEHITYRSLAALLKQILTALVALQSHTPPLGHFDIKPDNMMNCGRGRYKLIDWDQSHDISSPNQKYYAPRSFTSPIAWKVTMYSYILPSLPALTVQLGTTILGDKKYTQVFQTALMRSHISEILEAHATIFAGKTHNDVFAEYRLAIDLYSLGLSVIYLAQKHGLLEKHADSPVIRLAKDMTRARHKNAASALAALNASHDGRGRRKP